MRRIYSCLLHFDEADVARARALTRARLAQPWGGWPKDLPPDEGSFRPTPEVTVRWRSLSSAEATVREIVVDDPFGRDASLRRRTSVQTGREGGRGFAHVEVSLRSVDPSLTGTVVYENPPPAVVADLVGAIACTDGGRVLSLEPVAVDAANAADLGRLVMHPERRLPVVLFVLSSTFDIDAARRAAPAFAGLAHVVAVATSNVATVSESAAVTVQVGVSAQLWWATPLAVHGDVRSQWFRADSLAPASDGTPAWPVLRTVIATAAFRVDAPQTAARLAAESARRRMVTLENRAAASRVDAELLAEYERDLVALQAAERRVAELELEVDRLQGDVLGLSASFDAALATAVGVDDDDLDELPTTLAEAVRIAEKRSEHLVFVDEAHASAERWSYRRPEVVLGALLRLDRLAGVWRRGAMSQPWLVTAKAAGLPWVPAISSTAATQYRGDYVRTYAGREILLGPHLSWGNTAANAVRIYLYLDDSTRTVVVGHVGEHLRDTTKPH